MEFSVVKSNDPDLDLLYYEVSASDSEKAFCVFSLDELTRRSVVEFYIEDSTLELSIDDLIRISEKSHRELNEWADRIKHPQNPRPALAVSRDSNNFIQDISLEVSGNLLVAKNSVNNEQIFKLRLEGQGFILSTLAPMHRSTIGTSYFVEKLKQAKSELEKGQT